jgi:hypothetical protein
MNDFNFADFDTSFQVTAKPRTIVLVVVALLVLVIGIVAGVMGRKAGKKDCDCLSPGNAGFRAFSIVMVAVGIPLLLVVMIFFGCTTG